MQIARVNGWRDRMVVDPHDIPPRYSIRDRNEYLGGMSCGSTTILSRHPLTLAICISYARINERYAPRASLELFNRADHFGCGVPIYRRDVLEAITYLGNVSRRLDSDKV